ncbi:MAG TPA: ABC transporter permease [Pseudomonadales bacterium]|nr:ABC transporter permease [Pseudomonadales bacterium]
MTTPPDSTLFEPLLACPSAATDGEDVVGNLWRDVWQDVSHNPSALAGLLLIVLLVFFCSLGDKLWQKNPAEFDLAQISQMPNTGLKTTVIYPATQTVAEQRRNPVKKLQLLQPATTESVQLIWPAAAHNSFRVYRHELKPSGIYDLGMPLNKTTDNFYNDQLQLENRRYFYSVARLDAHGNIDAYDTLAVDVAHATPLAILQQAGIHVTDNQPASVLLPAHPLGTDKLGRDVLARLIAGGKTSMLIGFSAPLVFVFFGAMYGAIAGYRGGRIDTVMMAFADFVIALPFLLFMMLLRIALGMGPGSNSLMALLVALVLLGWPNTARLVRAQVLQLRSMAYIDAARLQGASGQYIVMKHLLPNVLPGILVTLSFAIPSAIFTEAFLSFIGLGVVPPATSWGSMCNDGLSSFLIHPHELLFPAFFISITVMAFNLFGDGLRDALDVKMREART